MLNDLSYLPDNGCFKTSVLKYPGSWYAFTGNECQAARQRKSAIEEENKKTEGSGGIGGN